MNKSETIGKLAAALAKAQGEMDNADKDSSNPHFKSKYADLASVRAALREPFSRNGLAYVQLPRFDGNMVHVETVLMHAESGEFISDTLSIPVAQKTAHGVGSAITYGRRFGLMAVSGVAPEEDDDGNAASTGDRSGSAPRPRVELRPAQPHHSAEPARGGYGPQKNNVDRIERPIDEIPHTQPKEAPTEPASSTEDNAPVEAAASVPAASPRKTVADVPTVAPGGSRATDWKAREREKLERREASEKRGAEIKANSSAEVRGNLKFHLDAIKPEHPEARKKLEAWLKLAATAKVNMTQADQLGITADYNLKLGNIGAAERRRLEQSPPKSTEEDFDEDGVLAEAAE